MSIITNTASVFDHVVQNVYTDKGKVLRYLHGTASLHATIKFRLIYS